MFWPLSAKEKREIHRLFETKDVGTLIAALGHRGSGGKIKVLDAAY